MVGFWRRFRLRPFLRRRDRSCQWQLFLFGSSVRCAPETSRPPAILFRSPLPRAATGGGQCSAAAHGAFIGCYYSNITLSGSPSLIRTDPQINFDWGGNTPDRAVSRGGFSVRWQGNFTFAQDTYTFTALSSDGMRLYIDGQLVMDRWYNQTAIQSMLSRPSPRVRT